MRTLLIVEDQTELAAMLAATAKELGLTPLVAVNGRDALALVEGRRPRAALVDLLLPDIRGQDLVRQLSARSITCIAMSGVMSGERIARDAVESGALAFVEKPFDAREVMERLFHHLSDSIPDGDEAPESPEILPLAEPETVAPAAGEAILSAAETTGIFAPPEPASTRGLMDAEAAAPPPPLEPTESDLELLEPLESLDAQHFGAAAPTGAEPALPESDHVELIEAVPDTTGTDQVAEGSAMPFDGEADYLDLSDITVLETGDAGYQSSGVGTPGTPPATEDVAVRYQDAASRQELPDRPAFEPSADQATAGGTSAAPSSSALMTPEVPAEGPQEARVPEAPPTQGPQFAPTPDPGAEASNETGSVVGQQPLEAGREADPGLAPDETAIVDIEPLTVPQDALAAPMSLERELAPADPGVSAPTTDDLSVVRPTDSTYLGVPEARGDDIVEIDPSDVQLDPDSAGKPAEFGVLGAILADAPASAEPPEELPALSAEPAPIAPPLAAADLPAVVGPVVVDLPVPVKVSSAEAAMADAPLSMAASPPAVDLPAALDVPVVAPLPSAEMDAPSPTATPPLAVDLPVVADIPVVAPPPSAEPEPFVSPPPVVAAPGGAPPPKQPEVSRRALSPKLGAIAPGAPRGSTAVGATRRQRELRLPLLGSLSERSFAGLLAELHHSRQTGELRVRRDDVVKVIAVHEGRPVFAASNVLAERLARFVLRSGRLTRDQLARVNEEATRTSRRTGDTMVSLGLLKQAELLALVAQQVREIIWSALDWTEGTYQIVLRRNPRKDLLAIALEPTGTLLLEGFRRSTSLVRLRQVVAPDAHFEPDPSAPFEPHELQLSAEEALVLSHADATKAVEDLILLSGLEERAVLVVVHALVQTGILRRCPMAASRSRVVLV